MIVFVDPFVDCLGFVLCCLLGFWFSELVAVCSLCGLGGLGAVCCLGL